MTRLYLVREEMVAVADLRPGDRLVLPRGWRVRCERVDMYPDGTAVVRWTRQAEPGEPGHRFGASGLYLGSLAPMPPAGRVRVDRR